MIFQTQNQLNCLLIFIFFGTCTGILFILYQTFFLLKFQKKFKKIIFYTIFYSFFNIFYIFLLIYFNFGEFSLVLYFSFLFGFNIIKNVLRNSFVIFEKRWYNILNKFSLNLKSKKETKTNEVSKKS